MPNITKRLKGAGATDIDKCLKVKLKLALNTVYILFGNMEPDNL